MWLEIGVFANGGGVVGAKAFWGGVVGAKAFWGGIMMGCCGIWSKKSETDKATMVPTDPITPTIFLIASSVGIFSSSSSDSSLDLALEGAG